MRDLSKYFKLIPSDCTLSIEIKPDNRGDKECCYFTIVLKKKHTDKMVSHNMIGQRLDVLAFESCTDDMVSLSIKDLIKAMESNDD